MNKKGKVMTARLTGSKKNLDGITVRTGQDNTHLKKSKQPISEASGVSPMGKHNNPPSFKGKGFDK